MIAEPVRAVDAIAEGTPTIRREILLGCKGGGYGCWGSSTIRVLLLIRERVLCCKGGSYDC